ncbi:MAG: hypothetical protein LBJ03_00665 [Holosporales bacterium]|nr:hypothetical protein [Holosporales bacterium]
MLWKEDGKARDQQQARVRISRSSAAAKSDGTRLRRRLGGRESFLDCQFCELDFI